MNTHLIGVLGENAAVKYLKKHGYKVLVRNFKCAFGEIDIVARDGSFYVFIEVKSRKNDAFGLPRQAVDLYKQQTIARCAMRWLYENECVGVPVRFDVVEVLDGEITLIKDAFRA